MTYRRKLPHSSQLRLQWKFFYSGSSRVYDLDCNFYLLDHRDLENWKVNGYGALLGITSSLVMFCGGGFALIA